MWRVCLQPVPQSMLHVLNFHNTNNYIYFFNSQVVMRMTIKMTRTANDDESNDETEQRSIVINWQRWSECSKGHIIPTPLFEKNSREELT